jgi:hypothetical protein
MCHFRCDDCNIIIEKGDPACAVSMWSEQGAAPYFPWEDEFIASMEPDQSASALPTLIEVKEAYCKYWLSQHTRVPESTYNAITWCYDYMRGKIGDK